MALPSANRANTRTAFIIGSEKHMAPVSFRSPVSPMGDVCALGVVWCVVV